MPRLEFPACVLARGRHWIAIDKPAGLPSRPAPGHDGHALAQLEAWLGPDLRPGVVHRIDRDTSGVLLFSLSAEGHRALRAAFRERRMKKEYLAWVVGAPRPRRGTIDLSLRRNASGEMVVDSRGLRAVTRYETLTRRGELTLLSLRPTTGRMHQLRVHLAARGTPILGDRRYGKGASTSQASDARGRQLWLHAHRLWLPAAVLALDGASMAEGDVLQSPEPSEFRALRFQSREGGD